MRPIRLVGFLALLAIGALGAMGTLDAQAEAGAQDASESVVAAPTVKRAKAIFAGGCFWCVESDFDPVKGVVSTTSGYIGGQKLNPTYEEVSSGSTGHAEAVLIEYDPSRVDYAQLLDVFWHSVDPTTRDAQFCDHGSQYRTAIFVLDDEQRSLAERSKAELEKSKPFKEELVTEIVSASTFYPAEAYHQNYYLKNPIRYKFYRTSCGRDARLREVWGDQAAIKH